MNHNVHDEDRLYFVPIDSRCDVQKSVQIIGNGAAESAIRIAMRLELSGEDNDEAAQEVSERRRLCWALSE